MKHIPAPPYTVGKPLRALIFDSKYDSYKVRKNYCDRTRTAKRKVVAALDQDASPRAPECQGFRAASCDREAGQRATCSAQGVIVYFRVVDGEMRVGDTVRLINTAKEHQIDELGVLAPKPVQVRFRQMTFHCQGKSDDSSAEPKGGPMMRVRTGLCILLLDQATVWRSAFFIHGSRKLCCRWTG